MQWHSPSTGQWTGPSSQAQAHGAGQLSINESLLSNFPRPSNWVSSVNSELGRTAAACFGQMPSQPGQRTIRSRQTIFRAGEALGDIPVICEGWAACVSRLSDGRRQILSFVLPGDLVSTNAVFADSLTFFVEAITEVRCSYYSRADLNARLRAEPGLIMSLVSACLAEKEEADQLATNLGRRRAEERIARLFLHLKKRLAPRGLVRDRTFALPLRQQHIADATGLTPVHVNRVIGALRSDGLIELTGGVLKVVDLAKLQRIADLR